MPAPYSAGSIFLQVLPSFRGVPEQIAREARDWDFSAAEKNLEDSLSRGAKKGAAKAGKDISTEMSKAGNDAGAKFSDGFSKTFERNTRAKQLFEQLEKDAAKTSGDAGAKAGEKYSGKFRDTLRKGIAAAQREVDALEIKFKDGEARRQLTELQVGLKGLDRNIELGMNAGKAFIQLSMLESKARELQDKAGDLEFRANIGGVIRDIATMRAGIEALSNMTIEPEIKLDTDRAMGAFERSFKGAIQNALRDIGQVDIGASSNSGQRAVADLRKQLFDLGDLRIGVDVSAETAREKLHQIRDELEQIHNEHWSVDLDANVAAAEANLAGFLAILNEIDGHHVDVDVDVKDAVSAITLLEGLERHGQGAAKSLDAVTGSARRSSLAGQDGANSFRAFNARILGLTAIAPLAIPALGGIAGAIAALGPLAMVAGAGLGVLILGLLNVGSAYKAMSQYSSQANQEMQTYGKGADTAAKQVRTANASLANAQKDAARASEDSARAVGDAERGVADARREGARAAANAARQIQDAERNVQDAERSLAGAQKDAQKAQEDLTQARADAAEQAEELALRVRDSDLDQRQAVLDLHQAEKELADARTKGLKGDALEKYVIAYDRAKLRIDQTAESAKELAAEQDKWAKTGVEGSDGVVAAQERVASANQGILDAQQRVSDAQGALTRARQDAAQQAEDSARRVSDAERSLADARRDQTRQQQDSQAAISAAQEQVNDALNSYSDALGKTNSAQDKMREAMDKLSPTGQRFILFLDSLKPKLRLFSQISEEGFLPGFSGWIDSIVNKRGPMLQSIIGGISGALGDMFARFGGAIQSNAFTQLFDMMDRSGPRFIGYMGSVLTNLGQGVASLIAAMEPLGDLFGTWLIEGSRKFKEWAANLSGSTGLQSFFEYIRQIGPKVGDMLFNVGDALLAIGRAVAPSATKVVDFISGLAHWIAQLDPEVLQYVAVNLIKVVLGMQAIFGLTAGLKSIESAYRLVTGAMTEFTKVAPGVAAVAPKIGMFAGVLGALYGSSETVRDSVNGALEGIGKFIGMITGHLIDLKDFAQTTITIVAAWKGFSLLKDISAGPLANLGKVVGERVAPQLGVMAWNLTRNEEVGNRVTTTMGKVGSAIGKMGNALPFVGIGLGVIAAGMDLVAQHAEEQQEKLNGWQTNLHAGGAKAQEAAEKLANFKDKLRDQEAAVAKAAEGLNGMAGAQEGYAVGVSIAEDALDKQREALKKSEDEYNNWWASLTPIEQAQANLAEAQNNLTTAIRDHGRYSTEAKTAAEQYGVTEEALKQIQYDVAAATSGLNQELIDQLGLMQSLAGAELGYEQAISSLTDAHQRSKDALAQYGANSKEYQDALLAEQRAELSTADAAQTAMETRYRNADATTRQAMGQAAYYLELERQKAIYGELPPRLEEIRAQMERTIDPTVIAAAKFYDLGVNIKEVPDSKTIIIDAPTAEQEKAISDLGFHVTHLEDGTVKITANSDEAQAVIDEILKPKTLEITVHAVDTVKANGDIHRQGAGGVGGGTILKATGGAVWGPGTGTSDSIPAWLSNGEYVVKAASVAKYGLGLLDAINMGAYRDGGLVQPRTKGGLPAFSGGGQVVGANWGGTIQLSGGNLNPLAGMWADALNQIAEMANQAAGLISGAFAGMKETATGIFSETGTGILGKWFPFLGALTGSSGQAAGGLNGIFAQARDWILGRSTETRDGANGIFGQLRDLVTGRSTETRDRANGLFGQMRDWLFGRTDETKSGVNTRLGQLRDGAASTIQDAVNRMFGSWGTLPSGLLGPVNTIIDKVLNNGLFRAFNSIIGTLGLDAKLNIPTANQVKLAAGGQVPGWSPHDKADNIPAWLTAGEYVQPVDVVQHYGVDFMERLRRKELPRYATGGLVDFGRRLQQMGARVSEHPAFGGVAMGGHGKTSLHYTGHAIDVNTRAGTSALEQRELAPMERLARSLGFRTIFMAPGHYNHLHVDDGGGKSILGAIGGLLSGALDTLTDPVGMLKKAVDGALGGFETSPITRIMAGGARKLVDFMADKVTGWVGNLFSDGTDAISGGSGPVRAQVQSVASQFGWGSGAQWTALDWLVQHESSWNPNAKNPSSTAYGLFQFLNGTWAGTGVAKSSDPSRQALAGMRYIQGRYGSPVGAKAFWQRNHWYGDGGPVQDMDSATGGVVPDLHDTGGWLMPGLNVIMNRTGRPEPTINPQTLDALQSIAAGGGGDASAIGTLNQYLMNGPTAREAAAEIDHAATVARRGGKY